MILFRRYQGRSRSCSVTQHSDTSLHRLVTRAKEKWELLKVKVAVEITSNIIKEKEKVSFFASLLLKAEREDARKTEKKLLMTESFDVSFLLPSIAIISNYSVYKRLKEKSHCCRFVSRVSASLFTALAFNQKSKHNGSGFNNDSRRRLLNVVLTFSFRFVVEIHAS